MKNIKVVALVAIILFLSGCISKEYTFPNKGQTIERIELLYNPQADERDVGGPMETLCTLEGEDADAFYAELCNLETDRCTTPPPTGYGFYVARVVYQNGDVEMFGSRHIEFIKKGSVPRGIGEYSFTKKAFEELFFEYVGITDQGGQGDGYPVPTEKTE